MHEFTGKNGIYGFFTCCHPDGYAEGFYSTNCKNTQNDGLVLKVTK